jgi:hypothetical protein
MLICFFYIDGIVHKEFVPPGQTVNKEFYRDVLRRLREDMRRKRPEKWRTNDWVLHNNLIVQLDSAFAHFTHIICDYLNVNFTGRWIGKGGPIVWLPCSPDLVPLDFFLWGYVMEQTYRQRVNMLHELKA